MSAHRPPRQYVDAARDLLTKLVELELVDAQDAGAAMLDDKVLAELASWLDDLEPTYGP